MAGRWYRPVMVGLAAALLALVALELHVGVTAKNWGAALNDWDVVSAAAQRWVHGGSYFLDRQLHGPYPWANGDVLYPPTALVLFVPFSFLPGAVWVAVPLAIIGLALRRLRPAPWTWPVMAALLIPPQPLVEVLSGNPIVWIVAALFATAAWGSPASLVLLKPTLLPFALFRAHTRAWWVGLAGVAIVSLPMLPLNLVWLRVVLDSDGGGGIWHNLAEIPYGLIPMVAWIGRLGRVAEGAGDLRPRHAARPGLRVVRHEQFDDDLRDARSRVRVRHERLGDQLRDGGLRRVGGRRAPRDRGHEDLDQEQRDLRPQAGR